MLVRSLLYVTGLLLALIDRALDLVVDALESLYRLWARMPPRRWCCWLLETADRQLLAARAYFQAVGVRLRCRIAYESLAAPLKDRYRRLKRLR